MSPGWEAGIQSLALLVLFLAATIDNEKNSSWVLFQRYSLSQLPKGGGKHKEDHLQGRQLSSSRQTCQALSLSSEGIILMEEISLKD